MRQPNSRARTSAGPAVPQAMSNTVVCGASRMYEPASRIFDLPRLPLEHLVAEEADLQRVDPCHPLEPLCGRDLHFAGPLGTAPTAPANGRVSARRACA